jgi:hypothetical protein
MMHPTTTNYEMKMNEACSNGKTDRDITVDCYVWARAPRIGLTTRSIKKKTLLINIQQ